MSATVAMRATAVPRGPAGLRWAVSDTLAITRRILIAVTRIPDVLFFSTLQPIMFVLLFVGVFGGSIQTPGHSYADYLIPGIFVQTLSFSSAVTSSAIAMDMDRGIVDRLRTLPIARSAVLAGRTLADAVCNSIAILLLAAVGLLVGWRVHTGILGFLGGVALLLAFGQAMSWIGVLVGLSVRAPEAASQACMIVLLPLVFLSNLFVVVDKLPGWLQTPAAWNPVTAVITTVRQLFGNPDASSAADGLPGRHPGAVSLLWIAAIFVVVVPLAVRRYRRT